MKTKSVGPDQDGRFYQVKLTKLEGIKEWFKQDDLSRADITWLITELENAQPVIDAAKEFVNNHSNEAQADFIRAVRKMESEEQS
jgi:hypothetical protein